MDLEEPPLRRARDRLHYLRAVRPLEFARRKSDPLLLIDRFNVDWFTAAGAASMRPVAGAQQEVDGEKLVGKPTGSACGLVNLLGNANRGSHDFCIGYAWTEFESGRWDGLNDDTRSVPRLSRRPLNYSRPSFPRGLQPVAA